MIAEAEDPQPIINLIIIALLSFLKFLKLKEFKQGRLVI